MSSLGKVYEMVYSNVRAKTVNRGSQLKMLKEDYSDGHCRLQIMRGTVRPRKGHSKLLVLLMVRTLGGKMSHQPQATHHLQTLMHSLPVEIPLPALMR